MRDLEQTDIQQAARLAIAMKDLVERFNLDALCYLGQHHVEQKTQTTAYLGSALLQESGIMTISEGDVHGVTMMMHAAHADRPDALLRRMGRLRRGAERAS